MFTQYCIIEENRREDGIRVDSGGVGVYLGSQHRLVLLAPRIHPVWCILIRDLLAYGTRSAYTVSVLARKC